MISPFSSCARFSAHSLIAVAALGAREYVVIRGRVRRVLLDGDKALAWVRGYLCDAAAIGACYHEHVGPPPKPLKSQIRDLQRTLGRAEVPGMPARAGEAARGREGRRRRGVHPQGKGKLG